MDLVWYSKSKNLDTYLSAYIAHIEHIAEIINHWLSLWYFQGMLNVPEIFIHEPSLKQQGQIALKLL